MMRFRPNVVVSIKAAAAAAGGDAATPFIEETWKYLKIGHNVYANGVRVAKRCSVTTVDPVHTIAAFTVLATYILLLRP